MTLDGTHGSSAVVIIRKRSRSDTMAVLWGVLLIATLARAAPIKIVIITENIPSAVTQQMSEAISMAEKSLSGRGSLTMDVIQLVRDNEEESYKTLCAKINSGVSVVLDLTWSGWYQARQLLEAAGVPYTRVDVTIRSFVKALDDFLMARNGTDAALIFHSDEELDQALYYMIGHSIIRIIVLDKLDAKNVKGLFDMRPTPSFHAIFGPASQVRSTFQKAVEGNIVQRSGRWNLVALDWSTKLDIAGLNTSLSVNVFQMPTVYCCRLLKEPDTCQCRGQVDLTKAFLEHLGGFFGSLTYDLIDDLQPKTINCETVSAADADNSTQLKFDNDLQRKIAGHSVLGYNKENDMIYTKLGMSVKTMTTSSETEIGTWNTEDGFKVNPGQQLEENRRFFRIGVVPDDEPWSYLVFNETTNQHEWKGYCIDLAIKLAEQMQFDYEFSKPVIGKYGHRMANGKWDGLVGDLARGETDIVVAALMMTSEREEVIDFVAPYFDQSGISIMIRKPVRATSLFKFMTVLRTEVWISIVGALTITGIMIWLLDKYSPYSARNNKEMYPYPCREFTLKESFWFALTSFTPQGGGEAPKALSGRTLVAAYWLFVVLMLATFTANLAAFLTVERMKSPVESLEQLARQSKINYTVVQNSDAHQFFKNMKAAEDTLYRVWKELTLNATSDQTQYRVWDYPIKEQYGHILLAIEQTGPVPDEETGIQKVLDSADAEFAFIHDSAAIKYRVYQNCNLTEVGEVFAERPYAVAVQQGSQLQEEISRKILDLQKDRYFETESLKYWNPHGAGECSNGDDSDGITLGSLGGVFIATLFGLALAMITLAGEIFYHKHKHKIDKKLKEIKPGKGRKVDGMKIKESMKDAQGRLTIGEQNFRNFRQLDASKMGPKVSYISVFPRSNQPYD